MKKICVQCHKEFELTESEISFYNSKGLSIPKRCKQCRESNKRKNDATGNAHKNDYILTKVGHTAEKRNDSKNIKPVYILISVAFLVVFAVFMYFLSDYRGEDNVRGYESSQQYQYNFANENLWVEHFNKHGYEFGYATKEDYLNGAINVINNPNVLKRIQDDGDTCYYVQLTDEFVVVSPEGNIRTYFKPGDGNSKEGYEYFLRQQIELFCFPIAS